LTAILGLFDVQQCLDGGFSDVDLLFFSETMPNWHDSRLSSLINPEVSMFAGLTSAAVMPVDCVASTFDEPIDSLYWVAGCWGAVYNPVGYGGSHQSPVGFSSLLSARALHLLARIGFIERRMGDDAICEGQRTPLLVKSMYRMQMMFPSAEAEPGVPQFTGGTSGDGDGPATTVDDSGSGEGQGTVLDVTPNTDTCCHPIGKSTLMWGEWRSRPTKDHYVWLVSKWTDCCLGISLGN
jgi:conjugal transfer pilus assembly protein TraU